MDSPGRRSSSLFISLTTTVSERLQVGTADDFSNLNVLPQNLRCCKKKLFSFPTQQILARSVKKRRSYRSSKSSGLQTNLSPSLREKIRFDGTSGLIFHPDNGSFAYTLASPAIISLAHAWRCGSADLICFFSPCSSHKHWPSFLVCLDRTRKNPCTERSRLE